jgi:hypothetical protein
MSRRTPLSLSSKAQPGLPACRGYRVFGIFCCTATPDGASHGCAVVPEPARGSGRGSGLNATAFTAFVCPRSVRAAPDVPPTAARHLIGPAVASNRLSALNATVFTGRPIEAVKRQWPTRSRERDPHDFRRSGCRVAPTVLETDALASVDHTACPRPAT